MQHFEAAKRLRSNEFSFAALCALHKLAKHLPAYVAPIALRAVSGALQFRGYLAPKCYRPLRPYEYSLIIAHAAYRSQLRTCVRAYISGCIKAIIPFHVPKSTVVFARHPRVAQALYNHHDTLKQWAAKHEPTFRCAAVKRHPPRRHRHMMAMPLLPVFTFSVTCPL